MKFLLNIMLILLAPILSAEESAFERALNAHWSDCLEAIYLNKLKGEFLFEQDTLLSDSEKEIRKKYFHVPREAVEEFIIGRDGQVGSAIYRHELQCVGKTMNGYCGSSGCQTDFVVNDKIYTLRGGKPYLIQTSDRPILLIGRSGSNCNAGPNAAACIQAYVWDERWKQFNTMAGHESPIR